ncbi:10085_t:CDS:1, partial [Cetraspora pellucida]
MPCPGTNRVDGIAWYSPNFTQPGEFAFCEECYNQFIRNTHLSIYMRNDGIQNGGSCDFSSNVKQKWFVAVNRNDINLFKEYVEPKLGQIRELQDRLARLQILTAQELQRKETLISLQATNYTIANTQRIQFGGEPSQGYFFNNNSGDVEAARIQIQIDESSRIFNNYISEMRLLEHEISNS